MDELIQMINNKNDIDEIKKYCLCSYDLYFEYKNINKYDEIKLIKYLLSGFKYVILNKFKLSMYYFKQSIIGEYYSILWWYNSRSYKNKYFAKRYLKNINELAVIRSWIYTKMFNKNYIYYYFFKKNYLRKCLDLKLEIKIYLKTNKIYYLFHVLKK